MRHDGGHPGVEPVVPERNQLAADEPQLKAVAVPGNAPSVRPHCAEVIAANVSGDTSRPPASAVRGRCVYLIVVDEGH